MTNQVLVTITGLRRDESSEDTIKTSYPGKYRFVNQKHVIHYNEPADASGESVSCLLKADDRQVTLIKKTTPSTEMVFCPGRRSHTLYQTPMGAISMDIVTDALNITASTDNIRVELAYRIFLENTPISDNRLSLVVVPVS